MTTIETPPQTVRSRELTRQSGITYRILDYWCRRGILTPWLPAHGSGTQRYFDATDVRLAKVLAQLATLGLCDEPFLVCSLQLRNVLLVSPAPGYILVTLDQGARGGRASLSAEVTVHFFADGVAVSAEQMSAASGKAGWLARVEAAS